MDSHLTKAEEIAGNSEYAGAVHGVIELEGTPTKNFGEKGISRYEYKVVLKSNIFEVENEIYLNLFYKGRKFITSEFVEKE